MRELLGGAVVETLPITTQQLRKCPPDNIELNQVWWSLAADISRNFDLKFAPLRFAQEEVFKNKYESYEGTTVRFDYVSFQKQF